MKKLFLLLLFIPLVFSCLLDSKEIEIKPQVIAYYAGVVFRLEIYVTK